jgi:hypothetical protein
MAPERVLWRQRFLAEDVEHGGRELARIESRDQVIVDEMPAAPHVDDRGALGHCREEPRVEHALGFLGQWQQANQDLAPSGQHEKPLGPVEAFDAGQPLLAPVPAGDLKAQHCELARGIAAELAQAQHTDAALGGVGLPMLAPHALPLLRSIEQVLAMETQNLREHVLAHRLGHIGVDQAHDRDMAR